MIISQQLSAVISRNKLRDILKNKHTKVNTRKENTNQPRIKNFNINFNKSKNKDKKEITNNFEKNNDKNEIKISIKGKDSRNKIVTNLFKPIKLTKDKYFSNLKEINNITYNPHFRNEKYKIKNYENLNQKTYYHKRFLENDILMSDTNNNINFTSNNNLKNIISINNSSEILIFPYKKGKKIKNDNEQIKKYDIGGRIYEKKFMVKNSNISNNLSSHVKYEKIFENNSSKKKNQVKEIKKIIYNPHKKIRNQSMNLSIIIKLMHIWSNYII